MSLFNELKKRNVFRVGAAYLVSAWVIIQVADIILDSIEAPSWVMQSLLLALGFGFIIALIVSWAYELTTDGLKKEKDVTRDDSITDVTAKKLDYITLAAALVVIALFGYQQVNPAMIRPESTSLVKPSDTESELTISNKSIAVLPFTNMARTEENEPITLGLHDDLLTHLSKISALKVISRTSVLRYTDTQKSLGQIAKELGVANILEGGVQRAGNQIRINVQLIDAKTDEHLWAEIYDRELTAVNIFKIQTEISIKIAAALKAQISPEEQKSVAQQATNNLDAYNAYLAGRQRILLRNSADLKEALALFQKATRLDPNYALAYVAQADTLRLLNEYSDLTLSDMLEQGEALVTKALSLQPNLAEAHTSKASYLSERGEFEQAETSFQHSLSLNPNYATTYHWYGLRLLHETDRYQEALKLHNKAAELDPLSPIIQVNVAWSLFSSGQIEKAEAQFYRVLELAPGFTQASHGISRINLENGKVDEAIIWLHKVIISDPGNIYAQIDLGMKYLTIGDTEAAKNKLLELKKIIPQHNSYLRLEASLDLLAGNKKKALERALQAQKNQPDDLFLKYPVAFLYMLDGEYDKAIQIWLSIFQSKDKLGFELNVKDMNYAVDLAWVLKQSGQEQKAEKLIAEITAIMQNMSPRDIDTAKFSLLAVQGQPEAAAKSYAEFPHIGSNRPWYQIDQLPYLASMKKQPEYIKAHQQLMEKLRLQRGNLAQIDSLEQNL